MFSSFLSRSSISSVISSEPPSKSPQALILFVHPSFYLFILLLPEFFMVVLHHLIHSSRVHQDFVERAQVSSSYCFPRCSFFQFSRRHCMFISSVSFHLVKFMFYSFHVQSEFCLNPFQSYSFLISF